MKFYMCNFQTDFSDWCLRHLLWNCTNVNVTGLHWWLANIGSGNGLVPSGSKPLPEHPDLCRHMVSLGPYELRRQLLKLSFQNFICDFPQFFLSHLFMRLWLPKAFLVLVVHHFLDFGLSLVIQVRHGAAGVDLAYTDAWLWFQQSLPPTLLYFLQVHLRWDVNVWWTLDIDGQAQDWGTSGSLALELLQSCIEPLISQPFTTEVWKIDTPQLGHQDEICSVFYYRLKRWYIFQIFQTR